MASSSATCLQHRSGPTARYRLHMFDRICREHDIEHRLTKPNHPWTNGQVERMNRTLKEATVGAITTTPIGSSKSTSQPSSTPTTSPSDSRPYAASRPTSASAKLGQTSQIASDTIQPTSHRD